MAKPARTLLWVGFVSWMLTLVQALALPGSAERAAYDGSLALLSLFALLGCALWWRAAPRWRPIVAGAAVLYLALYTLRIFVYEVRPLLAVMSLPEAIGGTFYVFWSFPVHELSLGEVVPGLSDLFRDLLMPLVQAGVLGALLVRPS